MDQKNFHFSQHVFQKPNWESYEYLSISPMTDVFESNLKGLVEIYNTDNDVKNDLEKLAKNGFFLKNPIELFNTTTSAVKKYRERDSKVTSEKEIKSMFDESLDEVNKMFGLSLDLKLDVVSNETINSHRKEVVGVIAEAEPLTIRTGLFVDEKRVVVADRFLDADNTEKQWCTGELRDCLFEEVIHGVKHHCDGTLGKNIFIPIVNSLEANVFYGFTEAYPFAVRTTIARNHKDMIPSLFYNFTQLALGGLHKELLERTRIGISGFAVSYAGIESLHSEEVLDFKDIANFDVVYAPNDSCARMSLSRSHPTYAERSEKAKKLFYKAPIMISES
jgi:hypothetical protein